MLWLISPRQPVQLGPEDRIETRPGEALAPHDYAKCWFGLVDLCFTTVAEIGECDERILDACSASVVEEVKSFCSQHSAGTILRWRGSQIVETGPWLTPGAGLAFVLARPENWVQSKPENLADLTKREILRAHGIPCGDDPLPAMREQGVVGLSEDGDVRPSSES